MKTCNNNSTKNYFSVVSKNGMCSIQDDGRIASQHLGFTAGGASDEYAFLAANYLLGNNLIDNNLVGKTSIPALSHNLSDHSIQSNVTNSQKSCAALEITLGQLSLKFHQHTTIAITGANCFTTLNDKPIDNWKVHQLKPNDTLVFSTPKKGLHSYLAFYQGIQSKEWLNSKSQSFTEQSLNFCEPIITEGSEINLADNCVIEDNELSNIQPISTSFYDYLSPLENDLVHSKGGVKSNTKAITYSTSSKPLTLRFIPQKLWFDLTAHQQKQFLTQVFSISAQSNRMGYRLSNVSESIQRIVASQPPMLSKPVTYGTIQLPSNGQPIVLMKERQTIGGYPVVGCVIQTDLFRLSQLRPGETVQFTLTTLAFAQQQIKALHHRFSV